MLSHFVAQEAEQIVHLQSTCPSVLGDTEGTEPQDTESQIESDASSMCVCLYVWMGEYGQLD